MYSIGIDVGYSSVKVVLINSTNEIIFSKYQLHKGKIKGCLRKIFREINDKFDTREIIYGTVIGSIGQYLFSGGAIKNVNDISAVIEGCCCLHPDVKSIIEIGGQSAKYITGLNTNQAHSLKISRGSTLSISSNSDCAAGTGSFLEEQAARLNIKIQDYATLTQKATSIPRIAGRCSVFAKTDIIHHQQEGVSQEDILKGLAYAIVKNYKGSIIKRLPLREPILFVGGVANNKAIVDALRDVLHKTDDELIVPPYFAETGPMGAAILAKQAGNRVDFDTLWEELKTLDDVKTGNYCKEKLVNLGSVKNEGQENKHQIIINDTLPAADDYFLGIDVGSTSTNLVLTDKDKNIISYKYIRSIGNPLQAVQNGLKQINHEFVEKVKIAGVGITGSGRHLIGKLIGADVIKDEITAQAKAAVEFDPEVDTIFEIGGQDSKYISVSNGAVVDFQMNKICAAGTGSFLEEQSQKFNIPIEKFGEMALSSNHPVYLGERCTVFIESSIVSSLSQGEKTEDIVSGLCYSIAKNYLNRVVGRKKIGDRIFLQGGIAFNPGVLNAMQILTQKKIVTPPFFSVTGAYGAALMAREEIEHKESQFIGLENWNKITRDRKCSALEVNKKPVDQYNEKIEKLIFADYDQNIDPQKKTVGIPRALFTYGMFPMFNAIFKELGFNVLLSDWSNENTIKLGQEYSLDETCFPVKLINGHVAELVSKKVDYLFFPDLFTVNHPGSSSRQNYGCPYMQLAFKVVNQAMELDKRGVQLLSPTIAFSQGQEFMQNIFSDLGRQLGKSNEKTQKALRKGMEAFCQFEKRIGKYGGEELAKIDNKKVTFVIISKSYGVADPVLNLGIPAKLMDMGYQVIPFLGLPEGDISREHPNMFWPFGQHILESASVVRDQPNMYAIFLTHHGCGPDSVLTHFFKEMMDGKPYLNIEIDEHASTIGIETRLEAFVNSLRSRNTKQAEESNCNTIDASRQVNIKSSLEELKPETKIYIPNIYPYSELIEEVFVQEGIDVGTLPEPNETSIGIGRKFTLTNEYYSLTSFIGDCFTKLENKNGDKNIAFLFPQMEGAEVDGQYSRLLRSKLDEERQNDVAVVAPFFEDVIKSTSNRSMKLFYCFLAGDIIRTALPEKRSFYLSRMKTIIRHNEFHMANLKKISAQVYGELHKRKFNKIIMAIGEPMIVYNDFLNDYTFKKLEEQNHKVVYSPFSEAVWMFWNDYIKQNPKHGSKEVQNRLSDFKEDIQIISEQLKEESPFANNLDDLVQTANNTIDYFSGAFARYRQAKVLQDLSVDGIIKAASTYENTGVCLNILHKGFANGNAVPILDLSFDGNSNENDKNKVESFVYYL
ncbi:CoA activase [Marinilabiliaceae bacterium JC017]|nr:CoA activase [Marinilabiliaceae bacterium JC017]